MKKVKEWLKTVHRRKIEQEFDRVVIVLGDEGHGKSTLMLQLNVLWRRIRDLQVNNDEMLDRLVWTREEYKDALTQFNKRDAILAPDGARIFYKKDAMTSEQKELEKDMLQSRIQENLILLGFQDWDTIPTQLQERRAHNVLHITSRGKIKGYSRSAIDNRVEYDNWPNPDLVDTFPSLDGTDLWREYQAVDKEKKIELMSREEEDEEDEISIKDIADEILEDGVERFVSINSSNKTPYVDADLIEVEYDLSIRKAKKVKKFVQRGVDLDKLEIAAAN